MSLLPNRFLMQPKYLFAACFSLLLVSQSSEAQLLKKIKDKVNKTVGKDTDADKKEEEKASSGGNSTTNASTNSTNTSSAPAQHDKNPKWCEGLEASGGTGASGGTLKKDGVDFKKVYSSANGFTILYDESSLGISNNANGYRLVISERINGKTQFKLIQNGKVTATADSPQRDWFSRSETRTAKEDNGSDNKSISKYIVGDTMKQNVPKSDAKTVSINKVDDDQLEAALAIARQTDDYKNMSDAEKKEFEETVRAGIAKNNSMAGTKYDIPAQQGGTVALVNGYFVVIKGKKYGKFLMPPTVEVSRDESKFLIVGLNEQNKPLMILNGKSTPLDENRYTAMSGHIVRSPDHTKFAYIEQRKMTQQEIEDMSASAASGKKMTMEYNVIKNDGSTLLAADPNYSGKFKVANWGALLYINEETGEVFADKKVIGKFPMEGGDRLDAEAVLTGNDASKIAYYNGSDGSLTYLDGTRKNMDIIYPHVVSEGGGSYLSWFRKCGNDIYIARFGY